jgi:O-antigen ligase
MSATLEVVGCVAATGAVSVALLGEGRRLRATALVAAMALSLALVAGQGWDELSSLRDQPGAFAGTIVAGALGIAVLALALRRWPLLLPLLLVAALPFRIPIGVGGGEDVNLLVPLYVVIGAGVLATAVEAFSGERPRVATAPRPLALALVAAIVLYAVQASYSNDIGFAARNTGFFLVPFAVMFALLIEVPWTARLLRWTLAVVLAEALLFALVGIGEHIAGEILWNDALEMSNDFHFYFRVNSLFWDPNIYGRYLALAIVLALGVLVWIRGWRAALALGAAIVVAFAGLLVAFSQTSFISLLCGIAVLSALRWSLKWTVIVTPLVAAAVVVGFATVGGGSDSDEPVGINTEGRTTLIAGGIDLAERRPVYGHGSASFPEAFAEAEDVKKGENTVSHNEPVTVAAEQGAIGVLVYLALIGAAAWTLVAGMRRIAPGFGARPAERDAEAGRARIAILAAFSALLVHTVGYAGYLSDPLTWTLLAVGAALAVQAGVAPSLPGRSTEKR